MDVIKHDNLYHLFHLVLPNHDYIAHAVSKNGLQWQRVKNAVFIGDPEEWDDDMLWTMHVSADPYRKNSWRMFYTGLSIRERGRIQRIGLARSSDLYSWKKVDNEHYPLEISGQFYESTLDEGRHWVSFRDPFFFRDENKVYLLAAGRAKQGPIIRRGCVAVAVEAEENNFEFHPPLFHPLRYDDIEVPSLVKLNACYYLIGSIREDIKVHYWYADKFGGPYQNFNDNVLLPQGNYAARICQDEDSILIWNFFFKGSHDNHEHFMVPPKELYADDRGQLRLKTYRGLLDAISAPIHISQFTPFTRLFDNPMAKHSDNTDSRFQFESISGMEVFLIRGDYQNFMLESTLKLDRSGKCGFAFRLNGQGDGYYLSLDLVNGLAQIRAWRHNPEGGIEDSFHYQQLQIANFTPQQDAYAIRLIAYEQYLELSINDCVILSLADDQFDSGKIGIYVESALVRIEDLSLQICAVQPEENYPQEMY